MICMKDFDANTEMDLSAVCESLSAVKEVILDCAVALDEEIIPIIDGGDADRGREVLHAMDTSVKAISSLINDIDSERRKCESEKESKDLSFDMGYKDEQIKKLKRENELLKYDQKRLKIQIRELEKKIKEGK